MHCWPLLCLYMPCIRNSILLSSAVVTVIQLLLWLTQALALGKWKLGWSSEKCIQPIWIFVNYIEVFSFFSTRNKILQIQTWSSLFLLMPWGSSQYKDTILLTSTHTWQDRLYIDMGPGSLHHCISSQKMNVAGRFLALLWEIFYHLHCESVWIITIMI